MCKVISKAYIVGVTQIKGYKICIEPANTKYIFRRQAVAVIIWIYYPRPIIWLTAQPISFQKGVSHNFTLNLKLNTCSKQVKLYIEVNAQTDNTHSAIVTSTISNSEIERLFRTFAIVLVKKESTKFRNLQSDSFIRRKDITVIRQN